MVISSMLCFFSQNSKRQLRDSMKKALGSRLDQANFLAKTVTAPLDGDEMAIVNVKAERSLFISSLP